MIKNYLSKVVKHVYDGQEYISLEVPVDLIKDLDLVPDEVLGWSIDTTNRTATIQKTNTIKN